MSGQLLTGPELTADVDVACDVCVIGTGAGGAVLAAGLAERGLRVVMLEEGGHHTSKDFDLEEGTAYPMLYQERGMRATADLAISILQGRGVGGSTVVNWTTCFRTPDRILSHWQKVHGIETLTPEVLRPHFEAVEQRLSIREWDFSLVNANNRVLWDGARKLGWEAKLLRRNVGGCVNSGYCGVGCPVDGKQSMHLTYVPDAIARDATLYANTRADRLETSGGRVVAVHASVLDEKTDRPTGVKVTVRPKVCVSSGGAINGPALLLRSGLNENGRVGLRTFLHPVVAMTGRYDHRIDGFYGAPQSVGSHQFIDRGEGLVGFFLETPPVHPMLASTALPTFGAAHEEFMAGLAHVSVLIAISVDGLLPNDKGGYVSLRPDGRVRVDYPVSPAMMESFRTASIAMARLHLAAGAREVVSLHLDPVRLSSELELEQLHRAPYGALKHSIFTAHQMGGCAMGVDPRTSVVDDHLRHHEVKNLFCVDGSVLPTALGVNPSETIYAIARWATDHVAAAV